MLRGLVGGGIVVAAGGVSAAVVGVLKTGAAAEADLLSVYIAEPVPTGEPDSELWNRVGSTEVELTGQAMVAPMKVDPSPGSVRVRSLHDGKKIAFLLEWDDPQEDSLTIKTEQFRDAAAVLLGAYPSPMSQWMMGTTESPATILHWKADWQLDLDKGFQDLEVAFPNASFDFYPPLVNAKHPLKLPEAYPENARMWLPGWHVGNPLSQPVKRLSVEKLYGVGPGTLATASTQNVEGKGQRQEQAWRVVLAKELKPVDQEEVDLAPGGTYSVAFAIWSGSEKGAGSRKSLTRLGKLRIGAP